MPTASRQYTLLARRGTGPQRRAFSFCVAAAHRSWRPAALGSSGQAARAWLTELAGISAPASEQLIEYLASGDRRAVLGQGNSRCDFRREAHYSGSINPGACSSSGPRRRCSRES
jgi:hypothetical protein